MRGGAPEGFLRREHGIDALFHRIEHVLRRTSAGLSRCINICLYTRMKGHPVYTLMCIYIYIYIYVYMYMYVYIYISFAGSGHVPLSEVRPHSAAFFHALPEGTGQGEEQVAKERYETSAACGRTAVVAIF